MFTKSRILGVSLLIIASFGLTACGVASLGYSGKVFDAETESPVADALILARWEGGSFNPVDGETSCYHLEVGKTDAGGSFFLQKWIEPSALFKLDTNVYVSVYKPGYSQSKRLPGHAFLIKKFVGTKEERLADLEHRISYQPCGEADPDPRLREFYETLFNEASLLTQPGNDLLEFYRREVERISAEKLELIS